MGLKRVFHADNWWGVSALVLIGTGLPRAFMIALIRWRIQVARRTEPDTRRAPRFAWIGFLQAVLVALMVLAATATARGYGTPGA